MLCQLQGPIKVILQFLNIRIVELIQHRKQQQPKRELMVDTNGQAVRHCQPPQHQQHPKQYYQFHQHTPHLRHRNYHHLENHHHQLEQNFDTNCQQQEQQQPIQHHYQRIHHHHLLHHQSQCSQKQNQSQQQQNQLTQVLDCQHTQRYQRQGDIISNQIQCIQETELGS